ncbi:MAG TPA: hypothetical protein VK815_11910 [Candidatus Acidoferrales bacterium]|jgi:hypothetical protein|nr:hypothetical protein [Candidatus Acidoferrales bacterium]
MKTYEHTQSGKLIVMLLLAMAAVMAVLGLCLAWPLLICVPIVLVTAWLFHSLTIELTTEDLRWHFGPGLVSKRVRLAEIASAKAVQTTFLEGWGIHLSRFGWLYNVAGRDAVAIGMRNGKKFALGTDEPEALCAIIQQNLR